MAKWWTWATLTVAGLSAGCAERATVPGSVVADSAGIEIVTNTRAFGAVPVREIQGPVAREIVDEDLHQVTASQPLEDGRVAVGVGGLGAVVLYDETGARIGELGRMGEGPGEFRTITSVIGFPGDSLAAYDAQLRRLTVFPGQGGEPRVLNLGSVAAGGGWSRIHRLTNGLALVLDAGLGGPGQEGIYRNREPSHRIDANGEVLSTYGEFPGLEAFAASGMMGRAPFGALLATATHGDRLVVGTGEHPEFRVFGPEAEVVRIVRWEDQDRVVTPERLDEFLTFVIGQQPPEVAGAMREQMRGMPHAPASPTHSEILTTPQGSIWVGEYPGPESEMPQGRGLTSRRWVVFSPNGVMQERLETPQGFMPMALTDDLVWGVHLDEMDVESVRAYPVELDDAGG